MNASTTIRKEVTRPWWYRLLRSVNGLVYHYWWLVWLIFFTYLLLWYLFCFKTPLLSCSYDNAGGQIALINQHLDDCCDCIVNNDEQAAELPPDMKPCDYDAAMSGGQGYIVTNHELGSNPGMVNIDYDMHSIPDKMEVYYDNLLVASTNRLLSGTGSLNFYYPAEKGKPTFCKVVLSAPKNGTDWEYHIGCPQ